jgi:membrane dipeptidase
VSAAPRNVVLPWSLDGHCDSIILRFVNGDPLDLSPVARDYHVTVPRLLDGRLMALFAMVGDKRLVPSLQMIDRMHRVCREHSDRFSLCLTASEVRTAAESGRIAIVMTIEGQSMFDEHIEHVGNWHRLGVRIFSLTHGEGTTKVPTALQQSESYFGYLSRNDRDRLRREHKGLTSFARESLREMGRLGIACDLAHVNDATFWEVMEHATGPVCFTHGNCYALCPHSRNLTDEMLKALAQKGGVVGPCFYGTFVHQTQPTLDRYVGHILHALEIMGPDGVGIGTDFDGVSEGSVMVVPNPSRMGDLWEALDKRGVPSPILRKIAHDNFMRMLPA